uniref:Uncharacterized protein n=1 Tax=Octactis speculum TaxID=3111310 RepID=A0A7S2GDD4_9STRA|mmetsp:Transcript_433/g.564  ORF Transcript_433/g.564 Transcript_433/m.564 type:complete len:321 (+) Transcript_433:132-1094(+)|eukprot:CAMPEP_0185763314 /NCGR_PEP_ID=MMETSP1174-20130828/22258_1 /TAXON_ID=35687 /ORGANISM="Dictyocha speculum, Strain CCMP1381" /LENGTH=320 /DNA_ID=CAMNT_0028445375 /DNA_START=130 /DNA_END=1092 /DNA_ORIENTATION=+
MGSFHDDFAVPSILVFALVSLVAEMAATKASDRIALRHADPSEARVLGRRFPDQRNDVARDNDDTTPAMLLQDAFLRGLIVRAQHGGLACDVTMLHQAASLWRERLRGTEDGEVGVPPQQAFQISEGSTTPPADHGQRIMRDQSGGGSGLWYLSPSFLEALRASSPWMAFLVDAHVLADVGERDPLGVVVGLSRALMEPVRRSDALDAGVDFHVVPNICEEIKRRSQASSRISSDAAACLLAQASISDCRAAMWECSSGINGRRDISSDHTMPTKSDSSQLKSSLSVQALWAAMAPYHRKIVAERLSQYHFAQEGKEGGL